MKIGNLVSIVPLYVRQIRVCLPHIWLFKYDEVINKMYPSMHKGNTNKMATVIYTTF